MSNKENNQMPDTPWHIGYTKKEEEDPRRHKNNCEFYRKDSGCCGHTQCGCFLLKCPGSSHCKYYVKKEAQKNKTSKNKKKKYETFKDEYEIQMWEAIMYNKRKRITYSVTPKSKKKNLHKDLQKKRDKRKTNKNNEVVNTTVEKNDSVPTKFQSSCKFYEEGRCSVLNKNCTMKEKCLFHDNAN